LDNAVRYHFQLSGFPAICIASNSDNFRGFTDTLLALNYPENLYLLTLFTLLLLFMETHSLLLNDNFSRSMPLSFQHFAVLSAFGFSVINFLLPDRLILLALSFEYNHNIAIFLILMQFIYFRLFYSVGSITKK
jgi:hypothetical protein